MNGQLQPVNHPDWRQLLLMGERLMAQPTVTVQREIIVETAARLVSGQADLWLAESFRRLPGSDQSALFLVAPPSELMCRAFDTRQACRQVSPAAVAVPLLAHAIPLGVLQVERPDGPPFSDVDVQLIEGVAIQASVALRAARQVAIERWQIEQLSLVDVVSAQVANIVGLDELCRRVTDLILHTFNYYYVALFTLEPGQEMLRFRASAGPIRSRPDEDKASPILQVKLGRGIIGHVAHDGGEIVANDVTREPRYEHYNLLPETRSEVALPLKIENRVLGVLDVQSDQPDDFTETDMLVLRALANNIAIAVEDARLYGDLQRRAEQLAAVAEVSRAVGSILDLDTLLNEVVTLIHKRFGYPFVHLFIVPPGRRQIVYRAGCGRRAQTLQALGLAYSLDDPQGIVPWVACNGQTVLANDVSREPRYRPSELPPAKTRAELAVPLIFGGEVLGVLDVQSDRRNAFSDDDRSLFEALASNVAVALRNANLYRSERWRRQVADSLREVAGLLSTDLALDQVLDATLKELERVLPCDVAAIWLLRDDAVGVNSSEPYLCLGAVHGYAADGVGCADDLSPEGARWLIEALHADQPTIRTLQSPSDPLGAALGFPPDHSAIVVPLRAGERRLGVLTLAHRNPERYGGESQAMASAFASYAAVAIENARLYQAAQEQAYVSTVLLQVAEAVQSLTTLDDVLQAVVRLMPMVVGVGRCLIFLWDEVAEAFVPAAAYGLSPAQRAAFDQCCVTPGDVPAFSQLRLVKSLIVIQDAAVDPLVAGTIVSDLGFESLLLLPLLARGEVLGVMLVDYQAGQPGDPWQGRPGGERMAIIRGVAYQTATAVENAQLLEARQEEAYVSAALLQVAQAVVSFNELDDILGAVVRVTPILIGVERCIIFLWDAERSVFRPVSAYGVPDLSEAALLARRYAPGDFPLLDAVRERDSLMIYPAAEGFKGEGTRLETPVGGDLVPADFSADFAECPPDAHYPTGGQCSLLAIPLSVKGDVLGVMLVEEAPTARRFYERRLEIITGIAQQVAMAVQNDRLQQEMAGRERLERELQLAREIQQTFMPSQLPHLRGWELAVMCRPARQVGGDFYDLFELPGGRLGLVIADVADKGMPAALFMALTRALVRAAALEEESPAAALARVNDLLVPDAQHGMFVTAVYAVLSSETGQLIYANAGHNPPLWLRACGYELERLERRGMALGVLEGVGMEERMITLEPCDCLIFYTDGITDAFSPEGDLYGEERLRMTIQSSNDDSAQAMLDTIDNSVCSFAGDTPPSDDMTLMVLRRLDV